MKRSNQRPLRNTNFYILYAAKEAKMKHNFILILGITLTVMLVIPFTSHVMADDTPPSHVDIMDQAYLAEYNQRAVEAYATMLARQAHLKAENASKMGEPDWFGAIFLAEYEQLTKENYALIQIKHEEEEQITVNSSSK